MFFYLLYTQVACARKHIFLFFLIKYTIKKICYLCICLCIIENKDVLYLLLALIIILIEYNFKK